MVIFTYEDYLKYKEIQERTLNLRKELKEKEEEQENQTQCELNDIEEKYKNREHNNRKK